jgi:hypothetical protein
VFHLGVEHHQATASREGPRGSALPPNALRCRSWASVVSAPVTPTGVVLQSSLEAQAEQLQHCVARFESFLERAEATLSSLSLGTPLMKSIPLSHSPGAVGVGSMEDKGPELYGCFSPHAGDTLLLPPLPTVSTSEGEAVDVVMAPVLQNMPGLQDICAGPTVPLSVEGMKTDLSATSCAQPDSDSPLSREQQLDVNPSVQSDVTSVPIPPPPPHNRDLLFAKELCGLLSSVEDAIPGCGRAIACLLTGTSLKGKRKVDECSRTDIPKKRSLRCKDNKSGAIAKAFVAA